MKRPSGDQKGNLASCVPSRRFGAVSFRKRIQRKPLAEKTSFVPSGETITGLAVSPVKLKRVFSGALMNARTTCVCDADLTSRQ